MAEREAADVVVREALPEDAPALNRAIGKIEEETEFLGEPGESRSWAEGFSERLRAIREKAGGLYLLAMHGDEIIGFLAAFAGTVERARGAIFIASVGLRRAWRGRGIGTRLFVAVEDWARARNAWRLELRVDADNGHGLALYRKRGFAIEGKISNAFYVDGRPRMHCLMGKALCALKAPPWAPLDLAPSPAAEPGTVSFRPLRPEEAPLLCRWERQLLGETPFLLKRPEEVLDASAMAGVIAAELAEAGHFSLAALAVTKDDAAVVGYVNAWKEAPLRMRHDAFVLLNVLRSHWGRGIGGTLAARLEAWARENGVLRLTTVISAHNRRALRFAEARGFRIEAASPHYALVDGGTVDRLRLGKLLLPDRG
jgi:RimJ/RimL family protein N-acetyltransferase